MELNLKQMVNEMYEERNGAEFHELENVRFTATVPSENLAVIDAIAETFGKTRTDIVADLINQSALGMFCCLNSPELEQVAEIADQKHLDYCKKVYTEYNRSGDGKWTVYANSVKKGRENADA